MQFTFNYIDLKAAKQQNMQPEDIIARDGSAVWAFLDKPIYPGYKENIQDRWRCNYDSKFIRIPLLPYCSVGLDPENVIGHAVSLGFEAARQLNILYPNNTRIRRLHLSIGNPVEELRSYINTSTDLNISNASKAKLDSFRYWIGIGAELV